MRSFGGAAALAVLSFISATAAQDKQACQYVPKWVTCKGDPDVQCATFQVPKNWYDASQGDIILRLIRDPVLDVNGAVNQDAKSLFYNPGGPGGSGIDSVLQSSGNTNGIPRSRLKQ